MQVPGFSPPVSPSEALLRTGPEEGMPSRHMDDSQRSAKEVDLFYTDALFADHTTGKDVRMAQMQEGLHPNSSTATASDTTTAAGDAADTTNRVRSAHLSDEDSLQLPEEDNVFEAKARCEDTRVGEEASFGSHDLPPRCLTPSPPTTSTSGASTVSPTSPPTSSANFPTETKTTLRTKRKVQDCDEVNYTCFY